MRMSAALIILHNNMLLAYRSIRKPMPPKTRIIRPLKGRGYRRPKNKEDIRANE